MIDAPGANVDVLPNRNVMIPGVNDKVVVSMWNICPLPVNTHR